MKKTISINLNSFIFNIDEDAYNKLRTYLNKLEDHFSKFEEGNEIVKDIETRIAEIFNMKISENKQVINIEDVNELISILGNVEDIVGDNNEDNDNDQKSQKEKNKKKFYRDPDNKIIAGVCSGLGAYTGLDTKIWRVIFILLVILSIFFSFASGAISIIAYMLIWIIVPEAKTTAQKIEMKGEKIDLSNIEKTVKEEYEEVKKNLKNVNTKKFNNIMKRIGNVIVEFFSIIFKIFGKILGILAILAGAALIAGAVIIFTMQTPFNMFDIGLVPSALMNFTSPTIAWILSICIDLLIIIPAIALIYWGIILLFKVKGNKFLNIGMLVTWIICLITFTIAASIGSATYSSSENRIVTETISINKEKPVYYFSMTPDKTFYPDNAISIGNIKSKNDEIISQPSIEFTHNSDSLIKIKFDYRSKGKNAYEAIENTKNVRYDYQITDSVTYLDPNFRIKNKEWYIQDLNITVSLPVGTKFKIDENLKSLIHFNPHIDHAFYNGFDQIVEVTEDGFSIISN